MITASELWAGMNAATPVFLQTGTSGSGSVRKRGIGTRVSRASWGEDSRGTAMEDTAEDEDEEKEEEVEDEEDTVEEKDREGFSS